MTVSVLRLNLPELVRNAIVQFCRRTGYGSPAWVSFDCCRQNWTFCLQLLTIKRRATGYGHPERPAPHVDKMILLTAALASFCLLFTYFRIKDFLDRWYEGGKRSGR